MKWANYLTLVLLLSGCDFIEEKLSAPADGTVLAVQECIKRYDPTIVPISASRAFCANVHSLSRLTLWESGGRANIELIGNRIKFSATIENKSNNKMLTKLVALLRYTDKDGKDFSEEIEFKNQWIAPGKSERLTKYITNDDINLAKNTEWCRGMEEGDEDSINCKSWEIISSKAVVFQK